MFSKYSLTCFILLFFAYGAVGQDAPTKPAQPDRQEEEVPTTEVDEAETIKKASYLFGYNFISRLRMQDADFDFEQVLAGLNDAESGKESSFTNEEQREILGTWQKMMRTKAIKMRQEKAEANSAEGEKAMAEFAKQDGAKELEDGIMYVVLKEGEGALPEKPDRVKVNYKGMYIDGEVFDSTEKKGEPMVNPVLRFVPGFSSAIQAMKVGSKWKIFLRGDKAYGMRPPNRDMGPNRALIFEVELLEIMPIE